MSVLGALGLVFLACAGYSAGAVLGARRAVPALGDVAAVLLLAAGAVALRGEVGRWTAFPITLAAALAAGLLGSPIRAALRRRGPPPREARGAPEGSGAWKRFAMRMGNFQGRLWMALLYFTVVAPFALVARLTRGGPPAIGAGTRWRARGMTEAAGLDGARRQH